MSEKSATLAKVQKEAATQSDVLMTLVAFSVALAVFPIGSYFATLWYVFDGNTTYSAITAIIVANVVLVLYIFLSLREDAASREKAQARKEQ